MSIIGIIGLLLSIIVFIIRIVDLASVGEGLVGLLLSFFFICVSIGLIVYDTSSPIEEFRTTTYITTKLGDKTFSSPVKITEYKSKSTRFMAVFGNNNPSRYEIEILSDEAIRFWEEN